MTENPPEVPVPTPPPGTVVVNGEEVAVFEADPKKPWKAITAAVLGFIAGAVAFWIGDEDPFTKKDAGEAFLAGLAASGFVGTGTWLKRNPLRARSLEGGGA